MALVNFHQLVVLHKLAWGDVGVPSSFPCPPPMPTATPMPPPSTLVGNSRSRTSFPIPAGHRSTTINRSLISTPRLTRQNTPQSLGSSVRQKMEPTTGCNGKYSSRDYKRFIEKDLWHHRVFVGMEDFMKHVLHVPDDWKTQWGPTIKAVKANKPFEAYHGSYYAQCETQGTQEVNFYEPLVNMVNAILQVALKSTEQSVKPVTPHRYVRNDPKKILCGILDEAGLSPDIVAVDKSLVHLSEEGEDEGPEVERDAENQGPENGDMEEWGAGFDGVRKQGLEMDDVGKPDLEMDGVENSGFQIGDVEDPGVEKGNTGKSGQKNDQIKKSRLIKQNLTWAQPLQVLEVKPFDCTPVDGSAMPRLMRNGTPIPISGNALQLTGDPRTRPTNRTRPASEEVEIPKGKNTSPNSWRTYAQPSHLDSRNTCQDQETTRGLIR